MGKHLLPSVGRPWAPGTLHPLVRSNDTARQAAASLRRQPRWDPCTERLLPGAGYRAAGCSGLSQPLTALPRLLKAEEQSLMPSPGSNPLLEHLLAVTQPRALWHGQEPHWPRLTPCLGGSNPTAQVCSPTIAPRSCKPSPPAPPQPTARHLEPPSQKVSGQDFDPIPSSLGVLSIPGVRQGTGRGG